MWSSITMKKALLVFFLVFGHFNICFADFYEFKKCFKKTSKYIDRGEDKISPSYNSWEEYSKVRKNDDEIFTINLSNNTLTYTQLRPQKEVDKINEALKKLGGDPTAMRVHQINLNIISYSAGLISAEIKRRVKGNSGAHEEIKVFFNLSNGTAEYSRSMYAGNTMIQGFLSSYVCEETAESAGEENISSGTAFFINNRGNLLTNNHVVDGCKELKINYADKEYDTKLIAKDKNLDLALLKAKIRPRSYIKFSNYNPKKLQKIYVAGYPFGKGLSDDLKISSGIISSLKGYDDNSNELQIDAAINNGNSGGPIVGEGGELVAIAVSGLAKEMSEGINFGIKSSSAVNFLIANDIDPVTTKKSSLSNDRLLKILEQSTIYISCYN